MIYGYVDGSGTHTDSKVRCMGAFIGNENAWVVFSERWNRVLDKPEWPSRIHAFGTFDCAHQANEFREHWPYAKRLALFGDLVQVIIDSKDIHAIGSSNIVEHFQQLPPGDLDLLKSAHLGTPLEIVCQQLFQRIIHRTREIYSESEAVALTFDIEPMPATEQYRTLYNEYASRYPFKDNLATDRLAFVSRYDFPPLQASDLLAYTTYQWEMETYYQKLAQPYFPIIPAFKRMVQGIEPDGGRFHTEGLKKLVAKVKLQETMAPHPQLKEKNVVCVGCSQSFVVTYDMRYPEPPPIFRVQCPHCKVINDIGWPWS